MMILLTHEYAPFKGGVAVYCQEIHQAAVRLGLPLTVWAPRTAQGEDITRLRCGATLSPLHIAAMAFELLRRSEELRGKHLILASYGAHLAAILAILAGGLKDCHLSLILHGSEVPRFNRNFLWRAAANLLLKRVHTLIFPNATCTPPLYKNSSLYQIPPDHQIIAPCAPSTPAVQEVSSKTNESEEKKTPCDKKMPCIRILTLARIHPRKGQHDVATALSFLPPEIKERITYVLGGKGDPDYLENVIQRCVQGNVGFEYLGEIPDADLAATYARCDIFAMTSHTLRDSVEGFGMSYIEAGWHGKPSVAYSTGGVSEAVLHGKTGLLVPEGNLEALSTAIRQLIQDDPLRTEMGHAARLHAQSFNWENSVKIIQQRLE